MRTFEQHLIDNMTRGFIDYRIIPRLHADGRLELRLINLEDEALQYYRVQGDEIKPFVPEKERIP